MDNARLRDVYAAGKALDATHLLIVGDVVTYLSFPVYVYPEDDVISKITLYERTSTLIIFEIYSYEQEFEVQLLEKRRQFYS